YLFGAALVVLLLAPFWLEYFTGTSDRPPVLAGEPDNPVRPTLSATNAPGPATPGSELAGSHSYESYADINLDTPRDVLQARFKLHLKNTRGMRPEIYEANDEPAFQRLTAYFYNNELKEFILVQPQRATTPLKLVRELRQQFGEPTDCADTSGQAPLGGTTSPAAIGAASE